MADMQLTSSMFDDGGTIPMEAAYGYAGGNNVSPDLTWSGAPDGTQSFAITCWDPDAPTTVGFVHLLVFDIDPSVTSVAAGELVPGKGPKGAVFGFTDWGENAWGGCAPPPGDDPHRYIFTVYALSESSLGVDHTTTYAKFRFLTNDKTLATGTLTGRFGL